MSQGITGIMLTSLATAQAAAIEDGTERVDEKLIGKVFYERMKPLHPSIRVLQSGDPRLIDQFDDLYKGIWPTQEGRGMPELELDGKQLTEPTPQREVNSSTQVAADRSTRVRARRNDQDGYETPVEGPLSDEQIKGLVTAESMKHLLSLLNKP